MVFTKIDYRYLPVEYIRQKVQIKAKSNHCNRPEPGGDPLAILAKVWFTAVNILIPDYLLSLQRV
jgi:hypothetical protein